ERTALRRPPQAFEKRSRLARRKTPFSPSGMASIARRSPNGRRVSFRPTCGWVRKIPVLTLDDEVIILAYRWRTRLSLDDSLVRLKRLMPQLSRSALYRCLERHGLSKIGRTNVSPPLTSASLAGPYRFGITANDVALPGDVLRVPVFLAVEEVTKHAYGEVAEATPENAAAFLARLVAEFPQKIDAVTTDIRPAFAHLREAFGEGKPEIRPHPFAVACSAKGIVHKRTLLLSREPFQPKRFKRTPQESDSLRSASPINPVANPIWSAGYTIWRHLTSLALKNRAECTNKDASGERDGQDRCKYPPSAGSCGDSVGWLMIVPAPSRA